MLDVKGGQKCSTEWSVVPATTPSRLHAVPADMAISSEMACVSPVPSKIAILWTWRHCSSQELWEAFLATLVILSTVLTITIRKSSLPVSNLLGIRIAIDNIVWFVSTAQVLLQFAQTSSPGLPSFLRTLFTIVQALQGDTSGIVPTECTAGGVLQSSIGILSASLGLTVLTFIAYIKWVCKHSWF